MELFAFGLEHNPATGVSLSNCRKPLIQYRSSLESLRPVEMRTISDIHLTDECYLTTAGGVCGIVKDLVRLFTLASASRGIPYKEWSIPCASVNPGRCGFCPAADVIAFSERREPRYVH